MPENPTIGANRERLAKNLDIIRSISKETYPNLHYLFHATAAMRTLEAVYGVMRSMEKALYISQNGVLFFAISERYLMKWWDQERKGAPLGSFNTWQGTLILLIHSGLLGRIVASDGSIIHNFHTVYEAAIAKGQRVENILYVPTYTPEVLDAAERCIAEQRKHSSLSGVTKTAIILSSGQDVANKLYLDGRTLTVEVRAILHDLALRINKTVEAQGYVTKEDMLKATGDYMLLHHGYRRKRERQQARRNVERVWEKYKRDVLNETGMAYRKPSAEEKRRYGLTDDRWIITTRNTG